MSPAGALHRFLFERLGRGLDATFWRSELRDVDDATLQQACDRGLCRELAGATVPCREPDCPHECEVVPGPATTRGRVLLPCPHGVRRDREVAADRATAYALGSARLIATLSRSSGVAPTFDRGRNAGARIYPVGTAVWARDAVLSLAVGVRRRAVEAEVAAAATLPGRPHVVLLPPTNGWPVFDPVRLREHGIHVFRLDDVVRWETLELDRYRILAEVMPDEGVTVADEPVVLELDVPRRMATLLGHDLGLTPLQFGYLVTLARSPGKPVPHEVLANRAYSLGMPGAESDPGQNKRWISETLGACRALVERGLVPLDVVEGLITVKRRVGYVLRPTAVLIHE
jgi:hypothetical protein